MLHPAQFGFRPGFFTVTCTLSLLNYIYLRLDSKDVTGAVFLDLKKAFDTINHNILCQKLEKYGVVGVSNVWFNNYLANREQVTRFKKAVSSTGKIQRGVHQGSILGPLLFIT